MYGKSLLPKIVPLIMYQLIQPKYPFSHPASLGSPWESGCQMADTLPFSCLWAHQVTLHGGCNRWWLLPPCLLIWPEVVPFSTVRPENQHSPNLSGSTFTYEELSIFGYMRSAMFYPFSHFWTTAWNLSQETDKKREMDNMVSEFRDTFQVCIACCIVSISIYLTIQLFFLVFNKCFWRICSVSDTW